MDKNKKIVMIIVLVTIIIAGFILSINLFNSKTIESNSNKISESTKSDTDMQTDIEFSSYDTYSVTLDSSYTITKPGAYEISGALKNGSITVNTTGNVKIVLNNVSITNSSGPAINIENADNVYIELVGESTLTSTTTEDLDGCIYSKDDLLIYGSGSLTINSNYDGIVSKDDLVIKSGTYIVNTDDDGIRGKDSLTIYDGTFTINSKGDALKTTNEIEKGSLVIEGGTFNIKTTGSGAKGIKSESNLTISGGTFNLNTSDDGIHSNASIIIEEGNFTINSNDDAIHADELIEINGGTFTLNAHEGLEATYVKINDGNIDISASDDGINATNSSSNYTTTVEINGGSITIKMGSGDTDAIDSNGNIYINGGTINITAQSPFDYDKEAKYTGGTIIVNGVETNQITNQMMGGMNGGMMPGQDTSNMMPNQMQQRGGMGRR